MLLQTRVYLLFMINVCPTGPVASVLYLGRAYISYTFKAPIPVFVEMHIKMSAKDLKT